MKKCITGLMVLIAAQYANATIHNVPGDYPDIQTCINFALNGDGCLVAPGTYNESVNFIGKAITLRSSGGRDVTTIRGTGGTVVKCISGEGLGTMLDGFTVTGGNALHGGGMSNENSNPTITNCVFSGNALPGGGRGGGMYNASSSPTITNCMFSGNSISFSGRGGGMYNDTGSNPTITHCDFTGNLVFGVFGHGGGMFNNSNPNISYCTFIGNSAGSNGGGMYNTNSSPPVTSCTFSGNSADDFGGGMYSFTSNSAVTNCTFSRNSAEVGGGMYDGGNSSPTVINCTFFGNSANFSGGISGQNTSVTNSIFWDNLPNQFNASSTITVTFSNIQGGWGGQNNINANPLFADITNDNFRLLPGSPSINMGNNTAVTTLLDLDHHARILCDTVDMGAYESGIGDDDCDGDIDLNDFVGFQDCMVEFMLGCEPFDFDGDGDVDLVDFGSLQVLFTN